MFDMGRYFCLMSGMITLGCVVFFFGLRGYSPVYPDRLDFFTEVGYVTGALPAYAPSMKGWAKMANVGSTSGCHAWSPGI